MSTSKIEQRLAKPIQDIIIPDCWHVSRHPDLSENQVEIINETWHLAHEFKKALLEQTAQRDALLEALKAVTETGQAYSDAPAEKSLDEWAAFCDALTAARAAIKSVEAPCT